MAELQGARVIVLGATGVLGGEIAQSLSLNGATLLLVGRDQDKLEALREKLSSPTLAADLRAPSAAGDIVAAAAELMGGIDGLINAAGVVAFGSLASMPDDVLDDLILVDLIAPLRVIRDAMAVMDGGFIVNITGVVAEQPPAGMIAYAAAKAGLSAAGTALARELRRDKILVVDARPPHTETGLASRPIAGVAPPLPEGLDPSIVAARIVRAIVEDQRQLSASDFS